MSKRWFRFYEEAINDPKVQKLGGTGRNRTGVRGFAVPYIATLPPRLHRTYPLAAFFAESQSLWR